MSALAHLLELPILLHVGHLRITQHTVNFLLQRVNTTEMSHKDSET